jgi:hypothetical protein
MKLKGLRGSKAAQLFLAAAAFLHTCGVSRAIAITLQGESGCMNVMAPLIPAAASSSSLSITAMISQRVSEAKASHPYLMISRSLVIDSEPEEEEEEVSDIAHSNDRKNMLCIRSLLHVCLFACSHMISGLSASWHHNNCRLLSLVAICVVRARSYRQTSPEQDRLSLTLGSNCLMVVRENGLESGVLILLFMIYVSQRTVWPANQLAS